MALNDYSHRFQIVKKMKSKFMKIDPILPLYFMPFGSLYISIGPHVLLEIKLESISRSKMQLFFLWWYYAEIPMLASSCKLSLFSFLFHNFLRNHYLLDKSIPNFRTFFLSMHIFSSNHLPQIRHFHFITFSHGHVL